MRDDPERLARYYLAECRRAERDLARAEERGSHRRVCLAFRRLEGCVLGSKYAIVMGLCERHLSDAVSAAVETLEKIAVDGDAILNSKRHAESLAQLASFDPPAIPCWSRSVRREEATPAFP